MKGLNKSLKNVTKLGEKAQDLFKDFELKVDVDFGSSVKDLKGFADELSSISKSVKGIESPKIQLIDGKSSAAIKTLKSMEGSTDKLSKSLDSISTEGLKSAVDEVSNLQKALQNATSEAGNLSNAMNGIGGNLKGAISEAGQLADTFKGVEDAAGSASTAAGGISSGTTGSILGGSNGIGFSTIVSAMAGKGIYDLTVKNAMTAETNDVLLNTKNMEGMGTKKYGKNGDQHIVDVVTDNHMISMNRMVPAYNSIMSSANVNAEDMTKGANTLTGKGSAADTIAKFGEYVQMLSGSEALADSAMTDLTKMYNRGEKGGSDETLDDYGLTFEVLENNENHKWTSGNGDFTQFMAAVDEWMGDTSELMSTTAGIQTLEQKAFSRGGKKIGKEILPGIKTVLEYYDSLDQHFGGGLTEGLILISGAASTLKPVIDTLSTLKSAATTTWDALKTGKEKIGGFIDKIKDWRKNRKDGSGGDEESEKKIPELPGGKESKPHQPTPSECDDSCIDCSKDCLDIAEDVGKQKEENGKITDKNKKKQGKHDESSGDDNLPAVYDDSDISKTNKKGKKKKKGKTKKKGKNKKKGRLGKFKDKFGGFKNKFGKGKLGKLGRFGKGKLGKLGKLGLGTLAGGIGASIFGGMGDEDDDYDSSSFDIGDIIDMEKGSDGVYSKKQGITGKFKNKMGGFKNKLGKGVKGLFGKGKNLFSGIGKKLTGGLGKGLAKSGGGLLKGLGKGLGKGMGKLGGKLAGKLGASLIPGIGPILTAGMIGLDIMDMLGIDWYTPLSQGIGWVLDQMGPLGENIKKVGGTAMEYLGGAADWFMGGFEKLMNGGNLRDIIMGGLKDIGTNALNLIDMISPGFSDWIKSIDWAGITQGISDTLSGAFDWLKNSGITGAIGGVFEWLKGIDWGGIAQGIGDTLGGVFEWLKGIDWGSILSVLSPIGGLVSGILGLFSGAGGGIGDAISGAFEWLKTLDIGAIFGGITSAASPFLDVLGQISPLVHDAFDWLITNGSGLFDSIVQGAHDLWDIICQVGDKINEVLQGIQGFGTWLGDTVGGMVGGAGGILGSITGLFGGNQEEQAATPTNGADTSALTAQIQQAQAIASQLDATMTHISQVVIYTGTNFANITTQITNANTALTMLGNTANTVFTGFTTIVATAMNTAMISITTFGTMAVSSMNQISMGMSSAFASGFNGVSAAIDLELSAAYTVECAWGDRMIAKAREIGAAMSDAVSSGMNQGSPGDIYNAVVNEFKWTDEAMLNAKSSLASTAGGVGSSLVSSFISGTNNVQGTNNGLVSIPQVTTPNVKNNGNAPSGPVINNNITINGDVDNEERVNKILKVLTEKLMFENRRAGRTV